MGNGGVKRDGLSAQYEGNSTRDCGASMNGGAVMCEMSPETVARKERKSRNAERFASLPTMVREIRSAATGWRIMF